LDLLITAVQYSNNTLINTKCLSTTPPSRAELEKARLTRLSY